MSDFMSYKGYTTSMVYDTEDKIIVGRVQDVDDIISFQGESVAEFESNFHLAIDDYLAAAEELGSAPEKPKPSPIMNVMTVDGYHARIEFDPELDMFRGEILGLNGGANFYGKNPEELRAEFKRSLAVFLEVCAEKKMEPRRHFSGKFNLRISPELHEKLAMAAQARGKSINALAQEALQQSFA